MKKLLIFSILAITTNSFANIDFYPITQQDIQKYLEANCHSEVVLTHDWSKSVSSNDWFYISCDGKNILEYYYTDSYRSIEPTFIGDKPSISRAQERTFLKISILSDEAKKDTPLTSYAWFSVALSAVENSKLFQEDSDLAIYNNNAYETNYLGEYRYTTPASYHSSQVSRTFCRK